MNIYDLEKQATPGPLRILSEYGNRIAGPDDHLICTCEESSVDVFDEKKREANAQLLTHCRNNFMKALEALKQTHNMMNALRAQVQHDHGYSKTIDDCDAISDNNVGLIKELETI